MANNSIYSNLIFFFAAFVPLKSYAADINQSLVPSSYTLRVSAPHHVAFFGTYLTDQGLIELHNRTPFEISVNSGELRLMLSAVEPNTMLKVELLKHSDANGKSAKPFIMSGNGRTVVMCDSNYFYNGKSGCEMAVRASG